FALEDDVATLKKPASPVEGITMLSFEDAYTTWHGGLAVLCDPEHHSFALPSWGSTKGSTIGDAKHVLLRPILRGPKVIGFWELDPDAGNVVAGTFDPPSAKLRKAIDEGAKDVGRFLVDELGHAKSFALDTMDALRDRAKIVRKMN